MQEVKPMNKRKATPPAETPEMNHKEHAFLSVTVPHWLQKNTIWKPSGRLVWGHAIRLWNHCGGEGLEGEGGGATPQHMFILSAVQETSLLPSSETRPHTGTGSPSVRSHNGFLEENRRRRMTSKYFQFLFCPTSSTLWLTVAAAEESLLYRRCCRDSDASLWSKLHFMTRIAIKKSSETNEHH